MTIQQWFFGFVMVGVAIFSLWCHWPKWTMVYVVAIGGGAALLVWIGLDIRLALIIEAVLLSAASTRRAK